MTWFSNGQASHQNQSATPSCTFSDGNVIFQMCELWLGFDAYEVRILYCDQEFVREGKSGPPPLVLDLFHDSSAILFSVRAFVLLA